VLAIREIFEGALGGDCPALCPLLLLLLLLRIS